MQETVFFDEPFPCFFIRPGTYKVVMGEMFASNGDRACIDLGWPVGVVMPFLSDVYRDEVSALAALEVRLTSVLLRVKTRREVLDGSMVSVTVSE